MPTAGTPAFYLFAGPNGSGKSTLQRFLARRFPDLGAVEFVNADEIAKALGGEDTPERAEQARLAADRRRAELMRAGTRPGAGTGCRRTRSANDFRAP